MRQLLPALDGRTDLQKLNGKQACGYCLMTRSEWTGPIAYWLVNDTSACDACVLAIAKEHNGEWLLPALVDIAERNAGQMVKLETPIACELHLLCQSEQRCSGLAYWRASGFAECDEHICLCMEQHPDSRECLSSALIDLKERLLRIGARVRIQMGDESGNLGTIYNYLPSRPAPWHVRPDGWSADNPGIAFTAEELDVLSSWVSALVEIA